jgi:hypothetical protein
MKGKRAMIFTDRLAIVVVALVFSACSGSSSPSQSQMGAAGGGSAGTDNTGGDDSVGGDSATCVTQHSVFLQALQRSTSCSRDSDCTQYIAQCLQPESGNCAGIFYAATSSIAAIDQQKSNYEACTGNSCNAGGACGLGPSQPQCVSGKCQ